MAIYTAWDMARINGEYEPKLDLKIARYISYKKFLPHFLKDGAKGLRITIGSSTF